MRSTLTVQSGEAVRAKRTALVVDDVDDMLDLLEIALTAANFTVLRASCASDALDLFAARSDDIDLLMTDIHVGTDSGLELARNLQTAKPSLLVLAISGFALDGQVICGKSRIEFLPKPFSTSELRSKLQSIFAPEPARLTITVSAGSSGQYSVATHVTSSSNRPRIDGQD